MTEEETEEEEPKIPVTILRRKDVTIFPKLGESVIHIRVTYVAESLPPATITFAKELWTPEFEALHIKEDLKRRKAEKPELIHI